MEEAFVLEMFHKGNIYELPAHVQIGNNGCLIYVTLPSVDIVFKNTKTGIINLTFLMQKAKRKYLKLIGD